MQFVKNSSTILINGERGERGELWQARFFDSALAEMVENRAREGEKQEDD